MPALNISQSRFKLERSVSGAGKERLRRVTGGAELAVAGPGGAGEIAPSDTGFHYRASRADAAAQARSLTALLHRSRFGLQLVRDPPELVGDFGDSPKLVCGIAQELGHYFDLSEAMRRWKKNGPTRLEGGAKGT